MAIALLILFLTVSTEFLRPQLPIAASVTGGVQDRETEEFESRLGFYWDAIQKRDLYSAQQFVLPACRNAFLQRSLPDFRSWRLEDIQFLGDKRARVRVVIERLMNRSGTYYPVPVVEDWLKDSGRWMLRVPDRSPAEANQLLFGTLPSRQPVGHGVSVQPAQLQLHFLNPVQRGNLYIQNDLDIPVRLLRVAIDEPGFKVLQQPEQIQPGSRERMIIEYCGSDQTKELKALMTLRVEWEGEVRTLVCPILYNHLSELIRAFFGLNKEAAGRLRHGDKLTPAVTYP